jgi:hypothetical protein
MINFSIVLRDAEGGEPLAVDFSSGWEELPAFMRRSDILGLNVQIEPRCEWVPDGCTVGNDTEPLFLHDIVFGNEAPQRVAPEERATITVGATQFDVWVDLYPSCGAPWSSNALFLARE